ncbi:unnamed protein product, partial [Rotaria sp. Silwood1]
MTSPEQNDCHPTTDFRSLQVQERHTVVNSTTTNNLNSSHKRSLSV